MNVQKIVIHKLLDLRNAIQDTWWSHAKIHNVSILSRPPVGSNGCSTSFFACLLMIFFLILYCGMVFNSMMSAFSNSCKELNGWWFSRIRLFSMSQTCSIGWTVKSSWRDERCVAEHCPAERENDCFCAWTAPQQGIKCHRTGYFKMGLLYTELMHLFLVCFVTVRLTYIFIDYPDCEYIIILNMSIVIYDFWRLSVLLSSTLSMLIFWNHHRQKACLLTNTRMIHTHMFTMNMILM